MGIKTAIQWCDSTVNPTMGCDGCELRTPELRHCYAGALHDRFGGSTKGYAPTFEKVTLFPGRMAAAARWADLTGTDRKDKPWLNDLPRHIFVSDMGDSLSSAVGFEYLRDEIIDSVASDKSQTHQWLWLSKRPARMAKFSRWLRKQGIGWPRNLWVGTSITTQATTSRIGDLLKVGGDETIRFVSVEPQVERVDLGMWLPSLDWVIQGGESGRGARPFDLEWAEDLIGECQTLRVPVFVKQLGCVVVANGSRLQLDDYHGGEWSEWPPHLRVREMPHFAIRK